MWCRNPITLILTTGSLMKWILVFTVWLFWNDARVGGTNGSPIYTQIDLHGEVSQDFHSQEECKVALRKVYSLLDRSHRIQGAGKCEPIND